MTDHFETLGLPRRPDLDPDEIRATFHRLSRQHHPDSGQPGADTEQFERLNQAQAVLTDPARRLRHLHELQFGELDRGGSISPGLMALFSEVGAAVGAAQVLARRKESARSALAKAVADAGIPEVQAAIAAAQTRVGTAIATAESRLPGAGSSRETLAATYRELAFLTRWRAQLQAAFASLF